LDLYQEDQKGLALVKAASADLRDNQEIPRASDVKQRMEVLRPGEGNWS
jgi:hypothetical protein